MTAEDLVPDHYAQPELVARIEGGIAAAGLSTDRLTIDDLAPVDEFHTGGRPATELVLAALEPTPGMHVLDVGCGLGGAARFCARSFGSNVVGVDLTGPYIEAAVALTGWLGLGEMVRFHHGPVEGLPDALRPDGGSGFDAAYLLHVGMNVTDKTSLFTSIAALLQPGARFVVYDLMRVDDGSLSFPLPWASEEAGSNVSTPEHYRSTLHDAGFRIIDETDHTDLAMAFVKQIRGAQQNAGGPPALGLHLLMGPEVGTKANNLVEAMAAGTVAPIMMVAGLG